MTFGEKFREDHQNLEKRIKTKEYLESYAKELKKMVYSHNYDDKHYFLTKNHSFTKKQIDYLQLKLDITIRQKDDMLYINPFEPCEIIPNHLISLVILGIIEVILVYFLSCSVCAKLCSGLPKLTQGILESLACVVILGGLAFLFFKTDKTRYVEKLKNSKKL